MTLFAPAFKNGGVRHTYWDIAMPVLYKDLLGGLAYRLPDGRMQRGYNGWNVRRFMMRLYSLQADAGLVPGGNGFHSTNSYLTVAMPWTDAVLDGERNWDLDSSPLDWVDNMPVDRMRSMSSPHSWGVAICWMANMDSKVPGRADAAKRLQAYWVWMHDSWRNPYIPQLSVMPQSVLDWGVNDATTAYHPYWRNPFVTSADQNVLVSLWHTSDRAMLGVFNYSKDQAKDAVLKVDLAKLGLSGAGVELAARDLFRPEGAADAAFDAASGTVTLKALGPHTLRLVGVRATDKSALARATSQLAALGNGAPAEFPASVLDNGLITAKTKYATPGRTPEVQPGEGIQVAAWRQRDRLLLAVINPGDQQRDAALKLDLDRLGITPQLPWQEFVGVRDLWKADQNAPGASLDFFGRTLSVKSLQPHTLRLIAVRRY
jgi:hypothetical protein